MPEICALCKERPATTRASVVMNGVAQTLDVCDKDFARLEGESLLAHAEGPVFGGASLVDVPEEDEAFE